MTLSVPADPSATTVAYVSVLEHVARYFDACDRCDLDEVMRILDGTTVTAGSTRTDDPAAIRKLYEARQPAPSSDGRRLTKHHATNLLLSRSAEGIWRASLSYFRLEPGPTAPMVAASGRLEQELVPEPRRPGRWRVLTHTITSDF